jgi:hypothetical protein
MSWQLKTSKETTSLTWLTKLSNAKALSEVGKMVTSMFNLPLITTHRHKVISLSESLTDLTKVLEMSPLDTETWT